jgi:hypothetical protein
LVVAPSASVYSTSWPSVLYLLVIAFVSLLMVALCLMSAPVSVLYSLVTFGSAASIVELVSLVRARPAGL